jgi:16S rRNA (cytidine1402-2'-O)-methyltransferase
MGRENNSLTPQPGCLYVVATPLGNLADLSQRAISIISQCDLVACEDKRTTGSLFKYLGVKKELVAYHEYNETTQATPLTELLTEGKSIALISDAGTPGISDPGFRVVRECRRKNIPVVPIPGPSALITLLSVSGLPTNGFLFVGFLPSKKSARTKFFTEYCEFNYTIALYESCHRIEKFLTDVVETLGPDRYIAIGREMTKVYETFHIGTAGEILQKLTTVSLKGEFVVLIAPAKYQL